MRWTLIIDPVGHPGWWNMALDQALLDGAERIGEGFVRCYRWAPWCLSLGRHEPAARRYDRARIEARKLDVIRRPTGGRAVWHARELTYAVVAPLERFGTLRQSYREIHRALARALAGMGAPTTLAPDGRPVGPGAGACFAAPAGGEVMAGGRKLAGSAQLRQGRALLQHGSILLEDDQAEVTSLMLGSPAAVGGETTLRAALGRAVSFEETAAALVGEVTRWPGSWREGMARGVQEALVAGHAARFRDPAWTWRC